MRLIHRQAVNELNKAVDAGPSLGANSRHHKNTKPPMNSFQPLTGFPERPYSETRQKLDVDGHRLCSKVNGKSYGIGPFEFALLADLSALVTAGGEGCSQRNVAAQTMLV